jgi:hypothetical protein
MATKKTAAATTETITPKRLAPRKVLVTIKGTSPLIMSRWTEKAKTEMRDKQAKKARGPREAKDTEREWQDRRLLDDKGRDCILAVCVKKAIVSSASFQEDLTKVLLRGAVFVLDELIPIESKPPTCREDPVRVFGGTADLRYRPEYRDWRLTFTIAYDSSILSREQLMDMISRAGFSNGLGEWRPQKDGDYGRFEIEEAIDIDEAKSA